MVLPRAGGAHTAARAPILTVLVVAAATNGTQAGGQLPGLPQGLEIERVEIQAAEGTIPATRISAPHVMVLTYAGASATANADGPPPLAAPKTSGRIVGAGPAAPGGMVSLFVEITPEPDTHVYAKGAAGYQPVKVTVKTVGGLRLRGEASYPPSVLHRFEALNEIVPVYEQAFRVGQDVRLPAAVPAGGPGRGQTFVIEGELQYQACTDAICYETVTVPLKWDVGLAVGGTPSTRKPRQ